MKIEAGNQRILINVRELARSPYSLAGGLQGGMEARAAIGREVHEELTAEATLREESIRQDIPIDDWIVRVNGRIDGVEITDDGWTVREIKTRFSRFSNAHPPREDDLRQLEVYLALLRLKHPELGLRGELVEAFPASGKQRVHPVEVPEIARWLELRVKPWVTWAKIVLEHRRRRTKLQIDFPHEAPRLAQKTIAKAVNEAYEEGEPLLLAAPTGSGKTAAVLTEVLRLAAATGRQVLWLTAKTPQQALPVELSKQLSKSLRMVQVSSKERVCLNEMVFCHPQACDYIRDDAEKLEKAWPDLVKQRRWTTRTAKSTGSRHEACPHLLGRKQIDIADLVIADFNYAFSPDCLLAQVLDSDAAGQWLLVVDEAHNLAERARDFFTATLPGADDPRLRTVTPNESLNQALRRLRDAIGTLEDRHLQLFSGDEEALPISLDEADVKTLGDAAMQCSRQVLLALEEVDLKRLQELLILSDEVRSFLRLAARTEASQRNIVSREPRPCLRTISLDAGDWLAERYRLFYHATFMSATLHPPEYYQQLLGLPDCLIADVESDFEAARRQVLLVPTLSTVYNRRQESLPKLTALLTEIARETPGRVAVFLPSFQYLRQVAEALAGSATIFQQEPGRSLSQLRKQLDDFAGKDKALFLAVTSGLMGEGVDFGEGVLQCLVIVGPALPAMSGEAQLRRSFHETHGQDGFLWTYAAPGMQRVVQAAGRLIRRQEDRGQIILIGERFLRSPYRFLIPPEWQPQVTRDPGLAIRTFWQEVSGMLPL